MTKNCVCTHLAQQHRNKKGACDGNWRIVWAPPGEWVRCPPRRCGCSRYRAKGAHKV